jgi:hypothetical protein
VMTTVPLDASLIEAAQVGAVLLEPPTVRIQMEITLWGGAEGGCEVRTRLGHAGTHCEIRASSNFLGTSYTFSPTPHGATAASMPTRCRSAPTARDSRHLRVAAGHSPTAHYMNGVGSRGPADSEVQ